MPKFLPQTRRSLPVNAPDGTLTKIPIHKETGLFTGTPVDYGNQDYDFYKFLKSGNEWIYLGKNEVAYELQHLYTPIYNFL